MISAALGDDEEDKDTEEEYRACINSNGAGFLSPKCARGGSCCCEYPESRAGGAGSAQPQFQGSPYGAIGPVSHRDAAPKFA